MSGIVDGIENKVEGAAQNKMQQDAQPGDSVERGADNAVNQKLDQGATDIGVPQQDDGIVNDVADKKVNDDIPFGN